MFKTLVEIAFNLFDRSTTIAERDADERRRLGQSLWEIGSQLSNAAYLLIQEGDFYDATETRRSIQHYAQRLPEMLEGHVSPEDIKTLTDALNIVDIPPDGHAKAAVLGAQFQVGPDNIDEMIDFWGDQRFKTKYAMELKETAGMCKAIGRLLMAS